MNEVNVLGVKIDDINLDEAALQIEDWIHSGGKHYVVTPNPEILVAAYGDPKLKNILNKADMAIPDGFGLKFSKKIKNTTTGIDLMEKIIGKSFEKGFTIGLLGGESGVAELLAKRLKEQYQNISVVFASGDEKNTKIPPVDIFFIALGAPKQEKWIADNLEKVPAKVMMVVGGSFDYLTGKVPRAPLFLRKMGLEWLFRLIREPWRIKRQLSLVKYLWLLATGH